MQPLPQPFSQGLIHQLYPFFNQGLIHPLHPSSQGLTHQLLLSFSQALIHPPQPLPHPSPPLAQGLTLPCPFNQECHLCPPPFQGLLLPPLQLLPQSRNLCQDMRPVYLNLIKVDFIYFFFLKKQLFEKINQSINQRIYY